MKIFSSAVIFFYKCFISSKRHSAKVESAPRLPYLTRVILPCSQAKLEEGRPPQIFFWFALPLSRAGFLSVFPSSANRAASFCCEQCYPGFFQLCPHCKLTPPLIMLSPTNRPPPTLIQLSRHYCHVFSFLKNIKIPCLSIHQFIDPLTLHCSLM